MQIRLTATLIKVCSAARLVDISWIRRAQEFQQQGMASFFGIYLCTPALLITRLVLLGNLKTIIGHEAKNLEMIKPLQLLGGCGPLVAGKNSAPGTDSISDIPHQMKETMPRDS